MKKRNILRIIAGVHQGRHIRTIDKSGTRPMTDRVRENLFNIIGNRVIHSRFLDLFAGSGAVGIEALSRGAENVVFVERDSNWSRVIAANLKSLHLSQRATILTQDVYQSISELAAEKQRFDLIFTGAPYDEDHHNRSLSALNEANILAADGVKIFQFRSGDKLIVPEKYDKRIKKYGITELAFLSSQNRK